MRRERLRPRIHWSGPDPEPWTGREIFWCVCALIEMAVLVLERLG